MTEHHRADTTSAGAVVTVGLPSRGSVTPRRMWVGVAIALASVVAFPFVARAALTARRPDPELEAAAVCLLSLALLFGGLVGATLVGGPRGRLAVRRTPVGLEVVGVRFLQWFYAPFALCSIPLAVAVWRMYTLPGVHTSSRQGRLITAVAAGLVLLAQLVHARPASLLLTQDSVVAEGFVDEEGSGSWSWSQIRPRAEDPHPLARMLRTTRPYPEKALASDPLLVSALLEYYRTRPLLRRELTDDRCLDRIRAGRF